MGGSVRTTVEESVRTALIDLESTLFWAVGAELPDVELREYGVIDEYENTDEFGTIVEESVRTALIDLESIFRWAVGTELPEVELEEYSDDDEFVGKGKFGTTAGGSGRTAFCSNPYAIPPKWLWKGFILSQWKAFPVKNL